MSPEELSLAVEKRLGGPLEVLTRAGYCMQGFVTRKDGEFIAYLNSSDCFGTVYWERAPFRSTDCGVVARQVVFAVQRAAEQLLGRDIVPEGDKNGADLLAELSTDGSVNSASAVTEVTAAAVPQNETSAPSASTEHATHVSHHVDTIREAQPTRVHYGFNIVLQLMRQRNFPGAGLGIALEADIRLANWLFGMNLAYLAHGLVESWADLLAQEELRSRDTPLFQGFLLTTLTACFRPKASTSGRFEADMCIGVAGEAAFWNHAYGIGPAFGAKLQVLLGDKLAIVASPQVTILLTGDVGIAMALGVRMPY